ncbi:MAG: hypothetical protein FAZ92_01440 [Accumulibacter sp.]|nr:MAG: hypothetical protein FAZ92_01440 [Accumulibacter sp.]
MKRPAWRLHKADKTKASPNRLAQVIDFLVETGGIEPPTF